MISLHCLVNKGVICFVDFFVLGDNLLLCFRGQFEGNRLEVESKDRNQLDKLNFLVSAPGFLLHIRVCLFEAGCSGPLALSRLLTENIINKVSDGEILVLDSSVNSGNLGTDID